MARAQRTRQGAGAAIPARIDGKLAAISFDGGASFYVSDEPVAAEQRGSDDGRAEAEWQSPFAFDRYAPDASEALPLGRAETDRPLFLVGCGNYAQVRVLPSLASLEPYVCVDLDDGALSQVRGRFAHGVNAIEQALPAWEQASEPVAVLCNHHSDHARTADLLSRTNPKGSLFVEKPPAITQEDLGLLSGARERARLLEVGFNHRYAPLSCMLAAGLGRSPKTISVSLVWTAITDAHWYHWPNQGTRISGNLVHWIDLCQQFVGSRATDISLMSAYSDRDSLVLSIRYEDRSIASISASARGNGVRGVQERIEVREDDRTAVLDDYVRLVRTEPGGRRRTTRRLRRDKGHAAMYAAFLRNLARPTPEPHYPMADLQEVARVTRVASELLGTGVTGTAGSTRHLPAAGGEPA